jgi:hypothetical protein
MQPVFGANKDTSRNQPTTSRPRPANGSIYSAWLKFFRHRFHGRHKRPAGSLQIIPHSSDEASILTALAAMIQRSIPQWRSANHAPSRSMSIVAADAAQLSRISSVRTHMPSPPQGGAGKGGIGRGCRRHAENSRSGARAQLVNRGTYARRLSLVWPKPVCMDSGSGPAGHPGMTLCVLTRTLPGKIAKVLI